MQEADLVKVDTPQGEPVDAFSAIVHRDKAFAYGTLGMIPKSSPLIPRQQVPACRSRRRSGLA